MVVLLKSVYKADEGKTYNKGDKVTFSKDGEAYLIEKGFAKPVKEDKKLKVKLERK